MRRCIFCNRAAIRPLSVCDSAECEGIPRSRRVKDPATQAASPEALASACGLPGSSDVYERARALLLLAHAGEVTAVNEALLTEREGVKDQVISLLAMNCREERDRAMRRFTRHDD